MRRSISKFLLPLVAVASLAAATGDETVTSTVAAEETCGDLTDAEVVADEHDVCSWSFTSVTAAGDSGTPPTLDVTLDMAGAFDGQLDGAILVWGSGGDCAFIIDHDGATGLAGPNVTVQSVPESFLHVQCGDQVEDCAGQVLGQTIGCERSYEVQERIAIDPPVADSTTLTWSITFDGPLAPWASLHDSGAVLDPGLGSVGPRVPFEGAGPAFAAFVCNYDVGGCIEYGGDFVQGTTNHSIG